ncbi:MAG: hypothetical protein HYR62_02700 [Actinobacteria bacterium]|nr:hypothetical protein [Actinomycetota bacterium]MBI3687382.1 hypothetical protein [Actinomycetota bacterium]
MSSWLVDKIISGVLRWFAQTIVDALDSLWSLLSATVFLSPDVTRLPQVTAFARTSLGIVNTCYVLAFLWVAVLVMGRGTIHTTYGPGELIPRLVIGLVAANLAIPVCSKVIEVANAVTSALTSQDITSPGSMRQLAAITHTGVGNPGDAVTTGFLVLLIGLMIAVLAAVLLVQWIIRVGVLVVAVGIAPVALALHGTPHTDGAARLWWRTLLGAVGVVVLQAIALHTTLVIFLDPGSNLTMLGLPGNLGAVLDLFVVVCLLWGVIKIPGLMRRYVTQSRPGAMGTIVRVVLAQQVTRGLSRALRPTRSGARAVAGRGGGSGGVDRSWPLATGRRGSRGGSRVGSSPAVLRPATPTRGATGRPLPRPRGAGGGRVGISYPTGAPVYPYTPTELARGVDLYTRALKNRTPRPRGMGATPTTRTTPRKAP